MGLVALLHKHGRLACAAMVAVLLLMLQLSVAPAPTATPSAELSKPPAELRELATGPGCSPVCGMKLKAGAAKVKIEGEEECVYSPEQAHEPVKALQSWG